MQISGRALEGSKDMVSLMKKVIFKTAEKFNFLHTMPICLTDVCVKRVQIITETQNFKA